MFIIDDVLCLNMVAKIQEFLICHKFCLRKRRNIWTNRRFIVSLRQKFKKNYQNSMTIVIFILIVLAIILALAGIVGAILPALPGPPLCWGSMLIAYFTCSPYISGTALWLMLVMTIVAEVLDYIAPIWMAKAGGGSRAAITGSTIGLVLGFFFMPIGLLVGPLLGAFAGEMLSTREVGKAIRIALLSFLSFLLSTGFQLILCIAMACYTIAAICRWVW